MSRKTKPSRVSTANTPQKSNRMLTLAAALMMLPASAWVMAENIPEVTFGDGEGTPAATDTDLIPAAPTDPIGKTDGGIIIYGGKATFTEDSSLKPGASNGNTVNVDGDVKTTDSGDKYYTIVGGATLNQAGGSIGNTVNVTAEGSATTIGNGGTGSVVGGATVYFLDLNAPTYDVGDAKENHVTLTAGDSDGETITVGKDVAGGLSTHGNVESNTVTINGGSLGVTVGDSVYGGVADANENTLAPGEDGHHPVSEGNASQNTVTISGKVEVGERIYGGSTAHGDATGNEVKIEADATTDVSATNIHGGRSAFGNANENHVTIKGKTIVTGTVFGGNSDYEGKANNNTVDIASTATGTEIATVTGGYSKKGEANENQVTISGGTVTNVTGGQVGEGKASGNNVTFTEAGTINTGGLQIKGGYFLYALEANTLESTGTVSNNKIIIEKGSVLTNGTLVGGHASSTNSQANGTVNVSGNSVTVSDTSFAKTIIGGQTDATVKGNVTDNSVSIESTNSNTFETVTGGLAASGNASSNKVTLSGQGTFTTVTGGVAAGEEVNASSNKVTIKGEAGEDPVLTVGSVTGGASNGATETGAADDNIVNITNATIDGDVTGGYGKTEAKGNQVTIENSVVNSTVIGGKAVDGNVINNAVSFKNATIKNSQYGGETGNVASDKATGNSVTIEGGKIDTGAGAITIAGARLSFASPTGDATGNTVTLIGEIELLGNGTVSLMGVEYEDNATDGDGYTGNTLEVRDFKAAFDDSTKFSEISGFEKYNFYFENVDAPTGTAAAVLTADTVDLGEAAKVNLTLAGKAATLKVGNTVKLFGGDSDIDGADKATLTITQGATLQYSGTLGDDGTLEIDAASAKPEAKALAEGAIAGLALLTQSGDLAAGKGISAATRSALNGGLAGFAAVGGGSLRYDTGSYADVDGYSLMAGLSYGTGLSAGKLTFGVFFEYGSADFDTSNSVPGRKIKGSGDTEYTGGGLLLRFDQAGGFYGEGSLRVGNAETEFSSRDLNTRFDTEGSYFGVHLGTGYIWKISDSTNLDLYAKYLWSHQKGDKVTLSSGDPVEFDDADSHRLRVGARLEWQATPSISPYAGLAYEHEFDGEAKATTYGHKIEAPELEGGTGIGEVGLSFKAGKNATLEVGAQAYAGKRDGVTGSLKLKVEF